MATKTMTQAQAAARAEQVLAGTAAAVTPRPRLDFDPRLGNGADQCLADIPSAAEMVNVSRTAWLRQIPTSDNGSVGQQILAFWKKQGYKISDYSGFSAGKPSIDAETKDYFTISLGTASNGLMSIGATSPCIYKNGTPPAWHPYPLHLHKRGKRGVAMAEVALQRPKIPQNPHNRLWSRPPGRYRQGPVAGGLE